MNGLLKSRLARLALRQVQSRLKFVYTAQSGLARGLRRRGGLGFIPGRSLTAEERWLLGQNWLGKVIYDVGAYQGIFTMFFARAVGNQGQVVAFEPNPRSAEQLREHVALNGFSNVRVMQVALGDVDGVAGLEVPKGAAEMSRLAASGTEFVVQVNRLDTLLHEQSLPAPSFIKVDVEGEELAVLRGSVAVLQEQHPTLLIEVHPRASAFSLWNLLADLGYRTYSIELQRELNSPDIPKEDGNWHLLALPQSG